MNYAGVFMRLLRTVDTPRTLSWALEEERRGKGDGPPGGCEEPRVVQVENGASLVLE